jgi:hypothetical protein
LKKKIKNKKSKTRENKKTRSLGSNSMAGGIFPSENLAINMTHRNHSSTSFSQANERKN